MSRRVPAGDRRGRTSRRMADIDVQRRREEAQRQREEAQQQRGHARGGARATRRGGRRSGRGFARIRVGHRGRAWIALTVVMLMFGAAAVKLVMIQTVDASAYAAKAAQQRDRTIDLPALRGSIYDRTGTPVAFTVQGRALAAWPALFRSDTERHTVARIVGDALAPDVTADEVFKKLTDGKSPYVYLARGLMPAQATALVTKITDAIHPSGRSPITTERQDLRQHPQGESMRSLLGITGWDGHGLGGTEIQYDSLLSGTDGQRTVDVDSVGRPIPGTQRDETPAVDGGDVTLTVDADLQYTVRNMLRKAVEKTGSVGGMAMVQGATDGAIYAMTSYYQGKKPRQVGNMPITSPYEPGSVAKVITFGDALQQGIITPNKHYAVPDKIVMGGHVIHDAWAHNRVGMTATGIIAKSSNVGTLMIAQQVGQDSFAHEVATFGLGAKTGIQLPGESEGVVLPQSQWSATTFANMPIGQGFSATLLQLSSMYQGIANGGVRIPPSIVKSVTRDGVTKAPPKRAPVRELSKSSADTLLDMLRGTVQGGAMMYDGTAPGAALTGYQVAGKTGTSQQVDPSCGCYSQTKVNASFVGIVPADHPAFVISVMLDAPHGGAEAGGVAAPLFRSIAAYALRSFDVPLSASKAPVYKLYTNLGE